MNEIAPQCRLKAGVCEGDITPPVGIYHRMWGAATHDRSTGVHRPLRQTTLAIAPLEGDATAPTVFIGVDHCLLWHDEMRDLLERVSSGSGVPAERITVFFSHTHAAGLMGYERRDLPGGDLIPGYLEQVGDTLAASVKTAVANLTPATIVFGQGECNLAQNRDLEDPETGEYVCGYNPDGAADKTVLVGRVAELDGGKPLLTIVNYACHPTTLAWDNTLISPDYVGAMRETLEERTGVPTLFIQGASGDIGPREGFVGDVEVADRNGRMLAYAALSALETMPPAGESFTYTGAVISGATIGTWGYRDIGDEKAESGKRKAELQTSDDTCETPSFVITSFEEREFAVDLPYRTDLPEKDNLLLQRKEWEETERAALDAGDEVAARDARAMIERATRRLTRVEHLVPGDHYPYRGKLWRLGGAVWIALDGEHYNVLQRELRERYPDRALVIGTLANGSHVWYLPDAESYGKGLYQETASVLARGSLETLIETVGDAIG